MLLNITGKQIDIGSALRTHVEARMASCAAKYFDRTVDGAVTFVRDGFEYRADCALHLASGLHLHAQARSSDIYASFDMAAERLEKRLRRYKRRLRDHHNGARSAYPVSSAREQVFAAEAEDGAEPTTTAPVVVSENTLELRTLTVGEAVMQLDLTDKPAVVFRNSAHGEINIVYRRSDGNIGWIDPALQKS
ncbi:MAG: ribosome-associated translation inhibitor RaiA [Alphaproteobacteria bacterium]|jgi:ribosome hibernation promoting factor|nr:ribosome-associated translation inhibitor RaiA [Alphaproteobacteria bacterium]